MTKFETEESFIVILMNSSSFIEVISVLPNEQDSTKDDEINGIIRVTSAIVKSSRAKNKQRRWRMKENFLSLFVITKSHQHMPKAKKENRKQFRLFLHSFRLSTYVSLLLISIWSRDKTSTSLSHSLPDLREQQQLCVWVECVLCWFHALSVVW